MKKLAKNKNSPKPLTIMSTAELAEATKEFNDPAYEPATVKMPRELAVRHAAALAELRRKKRQTKSKAKGARVQITLEPKLLQGADAMALREGISRSELFSRGLKMLFIH